MWEDVDPDVVRKILSNERNEAQKKFWAFFLLWVLILMGWSVGVRVGPEEVGYNAVENRGAVIVLLLLLAMIIWTVLYEYFRRTSIIVHAKYMIVASCEGRDRIQSRHSSNMTRGYFVSFRRPDRRSSGWVETSQEFYDKCTIGSNILVIAEDRADTTRMKAFDPSKFGIDE
ncbi:MAG: hypothetical protein GXY06_07385 [Clostridiaceae bacterium]|nr:hypothetical protein [Clostridiaceae bacterium]